VGFWDWISSTLTGERRESSGARPSSAAGLPISDGMHLSEAGGATAVLERDAPEPADEACWWRPPEANLIELAPVPRPELTTEGRALENLLVLHFDGRNLNLPPLPHVPERVLRVLGTAKWSMKQVAEEVGKDQVATAAVLQLANSPLYRGLQKITAIEPALVRLGANSIRTAMLNLSLRSVIFQERRKGNKRFEVLWHRSLASAIVMRSLSRFTALDPEEAFLIGLMHDIGNIIVLRITNAERTSLQLEIDDETFEYLCHEAHQEFGELLANSWSLPARLKALIADHHAYPSPDQPYRLERLQLHLTDIICSLLGYAPYAPYYLEECQAARDLQLPGRPDFEPFLSALADELDATLAALK
jgi:HD-like signal output (HDOD) protein